MREGELHRLCRPTDYLSSECGHVFPGIESLRWFIRQNREPLAEAGALVTINRRVLIDPEPFNRVVLEVGVARTRNALSVGHG